MTSQAAQKPTQIIYLTAKKSAKKSHQPTTIHSKKPKRLLHHHEVYEKNINDLGLCE
jgi:hypothetical protein